MRKYLLLIGLSASVIFCFAQKKTKIDYSTAALNQRPQCNVFNISSPDLIGGIDHIPGAGGAMGTNKAVGLVSYLDATNNEEYGTAYMIKYPLKKDTTYIIVINAYVRSSNPTAQPRIQLSAHQNIPNPNITSP